MCPAIVDDDAVFGNEYLATRGKCQIRVARSDRAFDADAAGANFRVGCNKVRWATHREQIVRRTSDMQIGIGTGIEAVDRDPVHIAGALVRLNAQLALRRLKNDRHLPLLRRIRRHEERQVIVRRAEIRYRNVLPAVVRSKHSAFGR
jgi:hypothetical protein